MFWSSWTVVRSGFSSSSLVKFNCIERIKEVPRNLKNGDRKMEVAKSREKGYLEELRKI